MKSEICHSKVAYLGHVVRQGQVVPENEAIVTFPVSEDN